MNEYQARDLLKLSVEELWALPEERHRIVFDDGVLETHTRATITSVYLWYPLVLYGVECPILKEFHLGSSRLSGKSMLDRINRVSWHIHYLQGEPADTEELGRWAFLTINRIYNDFTKLLGEYIATMSLFDAIEVMDHPTIAKANREVIATSDSIGKTHDIIESVIKDPKELIGNPLAESLRSGTAKMGQVLQCIGPLGSRTDMNSDIFRYPLTRGLLEGIPGLYGNMIESRSGSKALAFNRELIRDTEYFNRKLQMVAAYVQRLHHGDCGTEITVEVPVTEESLPTLEGKYYVVENTQGSVQYDWVRSSDRHLIGKPIHMRSLLGCKHRDPQGVCSTCYGRIHFSIPGMTNIGHVSAVDVGDKVTSAVLSTKHHDGDAEADKFLLGPAESKYLQYRNLGEVLFLKPKWAKQRLTMTVHHSEVRNLADILMVRKISDHPIRSTSQITQLQLRVGDEAEADMLTVSIHNRKASFSHALLKYLVHQRWEHDESGNVVIDLTHFDTDKPFLVMPMRQVHMHEVMKRLRSFLESRSETRRLKRGGDSQSEGKRFLTEYRNHTEALIRFNQLINEKLYVNIVHSEMLLVALTARSPQERDYRLAKPALKGRFVRFNELMENRSLGGLMALEGQQAAVSHPRLFLNQNRPDHPYDLLFTGGVV